MSNPEFYQDIRKFGWNNFDHIILERGLTIKEAEEREKFYIQQYDSVNNGYNRSTGGSGYTGCRHSEDSKKELSEKMKGSNNPNYRGANCTEVWRRRQSEAKKGKSLSLEHKKKIGDGVRGKIHHTEEFKDALRKRFSKKIMRSDGAIYSSCTEAAKAMGVTESAIAHSIKRKTRSAGYYWSYTEIKA